MDIRNCTSEGWDNGYKSRLERTQQFLSPNLTLTNELNTTPRSRNTGGDRFIPNRNVMSIKLSQYLINTRSGSAEKESAKSIQNNQLMTSPISPPFRSSHHGTYGWIDKRVDRRAYKNLVNQVCTENLNISSLSTARVLRFDSQSPVPKENTPQRLNSIQDKNRYIPSFPEKVLDMPRIVNCTNATLMDWNKINHDMVVALAESVFTWNPIDRQCFRIPQFSQSDSLVTAVSFNNSATLIAIASDDGNIKIWNRNEFVYNKHWSCSHHTSVICFVWQHQSTNHETLYSGCDCGCLLKNQILKCGRKLDDKILQIPKPFSISRLKLNKNEKLLAVTSSSSSLIQIIDVCQFAVIKTIEADHQAILGLIWCETNTLTTGSCGSERSIKIWNVNSSELIGIGITKSRIYCLEWGEKYKEIFSAHGHPHNCVYVWTYPLLEIKFRMCGHHAKVLHLSIGYEGKYLASLGVDETLLMWRIFDRIPEKDHVQNNENNMNIAQFTLSSPYSSIR